MKPVKNNFSLLTPHFSPLTSHLSRLTSYLSRLFSHPGIRRYGSNTAWMFAEQILRMVAGFLVGVWVARYLGPEKFGLFSYALAFVAIFQGIAKLGLDGILVRDLVREPDKATVYLGTAFWLKLFGAVITLLFIGLAIPFTGNDATINLYILIIASGLIFQSFEVIDFYFQSKVLAKYVSICKMVQLALSSLMKIFLILIGADLLWFVMVSLIDMITLAITLNIAYKYNKNPSFYKYFDINLAKRLLKDSWPLILSSVAVMIYIRIDQVMIKNMLGDKEVGLYSAAVKLVEVWYFIPMIVGQSLFPAIVKAKEISEELYFKRLQGFYALMIWTAIAIALPITFLSEWIVKFLYGVEYLQASKVLAISIWACVFSYFGVVRSKWLIAENMQNIALYYILLGALVNISFNLILIKRLGIIGAAISTIISLISIVLLFPIFHKKVRYSVKMFFNALVWRVKI